METIFEQQGNWARSTYKLEVSDCADQKRFLFRASWKHPLTRPDKSGFTVEYSKIHTITGELALLACGKTQQASIACPHWAATHIIAYVLPKALFISQEKLKAEKLKSASMQIALAQKATENERVHTEVETLRSQAAAIFKVDREKITDDKEGRKNLLQCLNTNPHILCAFFEGTNKVRIIPANQQEAEKWIAENLAGFVWWAEFTIT